VLWVISDIERVSGGRAHEDLLNESIRACQRGFCRDIALVVTKTDRLHLPEYLRYEIGLARMWVPAAFPQVLTETINNYNHFKLQEVIVGDERQVWVALGMSPGSPSHVAPLPGQLLSAELAVLYWIQECHHIHDMQIAPPGM
jgi:hypothetical protein